MNDEEHDGGNKPNLRQLIGSVLSAAVGIRSNKNRELDVKHGKLSTFLIGGVIFVVLFVFSVYSIVQLALSQVNH